MLRTQITLAGRLGSDPSRRDVGDHTVTNLNVAVNRKVKGEDTTDWFNVAAWGKLGEICAQYLAKGAEVVVTGAFEPRSYEKDGQTRMSLDVRANEVHFSQSKPKEGSSADDTIEF